MPPNKKITSAVNVRVKSVLALRERKEREETGLMIVEGVREIARARTAGIVFKEIYLCPDFLSKDDGEKLIREIGPENVITFETTREVFKKISFGEREEGALAVCRQPKWALSDLKLSKNPFLVIVESVEKPGNLGAILRTCDGAGADGLILSDRLTDCFNPNVVRASLGTVFSVKVVESSNERALQFLKENGIKAWAASPEAKNIYTRVGWHMPLAIVLGNEQKGLSDFWMRNCDFIVKIPMRGLADSLNVSSTAAILIYEALRQRSLKT